VIASVTIAKAANAGNTVAMMEMGNYYVLGRADIQKDEAQAAQWYRRAAQGGRVARQAEPLRRQDLGQQLIGAGLAERHFAA
jgi:TPR repeat protein